MVVQLGVRVVVVNLGCVMMVGMVKFELWGGIQFFDIGKDELGEEFVVENNLLVVIKVMVDELRVVFFGDVEFEEQYYILIGGMDLLSDVFVLFYYGLVC